MKKIKIYAVVSLDGYTARADGDIDWISDWVAEHTARKDNDYGFKAFSRTLGSVMLNYPYYNLLRSHDICWPPAGMQCYLFADSSYPPVSDKNIKLLPSDGTDPMAGEIISELLDKGEGDIWVAGDHNLIRLFAEKELIDEVVINILPITLGRGHQLSFGSKESCWTAGKMEKYDSGVVQIKYYADRG